jgi:hypothetical protein
VALFTWVGHRKGHLHEHFQLGYFLRHFGVSLLALGAVGVFLTRTLLTGIAENREREAVLALLAAETRATQGAQVETLRLEPEGDSLRVFATVLTPQEFGPAQVAAIEARLRARVAPGARLVLRSVLVRDYDAEGAVFAPPEVVRQPTEAERRATRQAELLATARRTLRRRLAATPGVELEDLRREVLPVAAAPATADSAPAGGAALAPASPDSVSVYTAVVRTPAAVTPAQVDTLERVLIDATGEPARLVVRSVLTRDATASGFLHEPPPEAPPAARAAPRRRARP